MADVRLTATNPEDSSVVPVACDASGRLLLEEQGQGPPGPEGPPGPKGDDGQDGDPFSGNFDGDVSFTGGTADFADDVTVGPYADQPYTKGMRFLVSNNDVSAIVINGDGENKTAIGIYDGSNRKYICKLFHDGHVSFAGNKAGFTPEGYLWCTTRRGDTVILDFTSNGTGQWVEYTPPSRKEQIMQTWESIREETDEIPPGTQ